MYTELYFNKILSEITLKDIISMLCKKKKNPTKIYSAQYFILISRSYL